MPGIREDWFPTCIWYFDVENHAAMNQPLVAAVRAERERDATGLLERSSVLGWHSGDDLHQRPEFEPFTACVLRNVTEVVAFNRWNLELIAPEIRNCWANINGKHASNRLHNHPRCQLSGVYYLRVPPNSGDLYFLDPRDVTVMMSPPVTEYTPWTYERVIYAPIEGRMLIFPSWLRHGVEPNLSDEERICLSFNVSGVPAARSGGSG